MNYNKGQQEAILHAEGPAMVVAGPGSGKTAVLTQRVDHMIKGLQIPPEKIMVITFTRAAAEEMKGRFRAFPGEADAPVYFATFHAAFYRILKRAEGLGAGSVIAPAERSRLIGTLLEEEGAEGVRDDERIREIADELSFVKAEEIDILRYQAKSCEEVLFRRLSAGYEERLRLCGKVDFDDMLLRTYRLLQKRPAVLALWQERYPYILVDEFQDIDRKQYEILKLLAEPGKNLFVVGDDDQSIYRFRGAAPELMQQFVRDYPMARRYELFGCYRCSEEILSAAKRLISHNSARFPKALKSFAGKGETPEICAFTDPSQEKKALLGAIKRAHADGISYDGIAVFCRTNLALTGIKHWLSREGIPCRSREVAQELYSRPEAEDIFTYLELASGPLKRSLFLRIMNRPLRYLPRAAVTSDPVEAGKLYAALLKHPGQLDAADSLFYQLAVLKRLRPYAAVSYIRNEIGYDAWLKEKRGTSADAAFEVLDILQEESEAFATFREWKAFAEKERERAKSAKNVGTAGEAGGGEASVMLCTMHGAKGLEFDAVFLPDVIEGNLPHKRSCSGEALEEERRLFYVAITRARRRLWIGWIKKDRAGRCEPSRFLREL